MLTFYSWNVNGIRAAQRKGFLTWLARTQPDIVAVQETKCHPDQLDEALRHPPGYHAYWAWAEKKGYSGVAVFTKRQPHSVQIGLGVEEFDREGRTLVLDYGRFTFINAYFPSGSRDHKRVEYKMAYKAAFLTYCNQLRQQGKSLIFCGDVNTAHQEIDLARPKQNRNTSGFLPHERAWIDDLIAAGYVDTLRQHYPEDEGLYTWWSYIGQSRAKNVGWRLDYFFVSEELRPAIVDAAVHPQIFGSDHCPVSLTLSSPPDDAQG